jgi:hypothetical protein
MSTRWAVRRPSRADQAPKPGDAVRLTIDAHLQRAAENALGYGITRTRTASGRPTRRSSPSIPAGWGAGDGVVTDLPVSTSALGPEACAAARARVAQRQTTRPTAPRPPSTRRIDLQARDGARALRALIHSSSHSRAPVRTRCGADAPTDVPQLGSNVDRRWRCRRRSPRRATRTSTAWDRCSTTWGPSAGTRFSCGPAASGSAPRPESTSGPRPAASCPRRSGARRRTTTQSISYGSRATRSSSPSARRMLP